MSYRIPPTDLLEEVIREVMREHPMISTQRRLTEYVVSGLREHDEEYTASEERVRSVTIDRGIASVTIHCREGQQRSRYGECPVCSSKMLRIRNETIFGGRVTLGYKCSKCPYWTGMRKRIPARYVFYGDGYEGETDEAGREEGSDVNETE